MQSGFVVILTFLGFLGLPIFAISSSVVSAQGRDWPQLALALEQNNLSSPVHITNAGDSSGRLFVVEQVGNIRILKDEVLLNTPFLSIGGLGERVSCSGERGLLSIVFPPNYAIKQHFYVYYTNLNGALVVA